MKRELSFALKGQSLILDTIGKTRSNRVSSIDCNGVSQSRGRKRVKRLVDDEHLVDCSVIQAGELKLLSNGCDWVIENFVKNENCISQSPVEEKRRDVGDEKSCREAEFLSNGSDVVSPNENCDLIDNAENITTESPVEEENVRAVGEESLWGGAKFLSNDSIGVSPTGNSDSENHAFESLVEENLRDVVVDCAASLCDGTTAASGRDWKKLSLEKPLRRFTRSMLKPKVDGVDISSLCTSESVILGDEKSGTVVLKDEKLGFKNSEAKPGDIVEVDEERHDQDTPSISPEGKLELNMTKKITLSKIPNTVRELLETGLLEGYRVYYDRGKKGPGLQGTIKGAGILCSCGLCQGNRVVAPSVFEIHACNSYRRAAQYICLENGRSFIQILHACKSAEGNALDATIRNAIGPLPSKKMVVCQNCKEPWSTAISANADPVCNSCMKSKLSPVDTRNIVCGMSGSSESALTLKSTKSTSVLKTLRERSCGKAIKMSSEAASAPKSPGSPQMGKLLRPKASGEIISKGSKKATYVALSMWPKSFVQSLSRKPLLFLVCAFISLAISLLQPCKGVLILAFMECASLCGVPRDKWYCQYCQNMLQREKFVAHNANAVAAGRVSGVDPIEEINKRCIRIVKDFEADVTSCALCRGSDFAKSGFGPRTILFCDQCEKEYHVGCLKEHKMADLKELPKGNWFCSTECGRIHSILQNLLVRGAERLPGSLVNVIRKKHLASGSENVSNFDVSWMLISGRNAAVEAKRLLSQAIAIFHDGFSPIIDGRTGRDLIPAMVYGRNLHGIEYKGMYCALLAVDSVVVSAAVFRVFGPDIVELPLVATINGSHGKGYFKTLFTCIERLFAFLKVRTIVLPAAEDALAIWTDKFGFRKMTPDEVCSCRKNFWPMMTFQGTVMLHKKVLGFRIINSN
ncbi:hypothetical protein Ancab_031787 [Ancistrocladus abbreviatus]